METIKQRDVSTAQDLIAAVRDRSVDRIVVSGDLAGLSSLELLPDQALTAAARATLQFKDGSDGIRLSSNNKLENLTLIAAPEKRAIFNDSTVTGLGCLETLGAPVIAGVRKKALTEAAVLGTDGIAAIDDEEAAAKLEPVDAVADTVNGATAASLLGKVKPGGIFASVLGPPQNAGNFPSVKVVPVYAEADPEALLQMAKAVVGGNLTIPIVAKMALKDASEAHILMSKGANGKVLLVP
jgi:hypothetical protein